MFPGGGCATRIQNLFLYSFANERLLWLVVKLEKENVQISVGELKIMLLFPTKDTSRIHDIHLKASLKC